MKTENEMTKREVTEALDSIKRHVDYVRTEKNPRDAMIWAHALKRRAEKLELHFAVIAARVKRFQHPEEVAKKPKTRT